MKKKNTLLILLTSALILPAALMMIAVSGTGTNVVPLRPEGPCDIYAAAGTPCVAAHSSTRALYASYNGPLYQVVRQSDGKTLDIGVVQASEGDPGGYADAAEQDAFCANTYCWITILYDQSGKGNNLIQAPRGGFSGPAMGGFNNIPIADMAPITIMGHKAYGIFIEPGMGLRLDDPKGTAVDDQAEGQYWVINGHHYNNGCCYDYGNAETDSRDDGDGTMETAYYGNANYWYHGETPGPWIMTDQENNLVGCVNKSPDDKYCPDLPNIAWRFVTAMADGEPHHWRSMGGDAQQGDLQIMFDGPRVINDRSSYDPMRKQGAILLGNGGDNSNGSQGTFYEGAMTTAGTFPTQETNRKIQANIVAAKYDVQRLTFAPANAIDAPPGLQTFSPLSSRNVAVSFTNTAGVPVKALTLSISVPKDWKSILLGFKESSKVFNDPMVPGAVVSATFTVTSGQKFFNGDLVANASWTNTMTGKKESETTAEKVRNVSPIKINEFRVSDGSLDNQTNSFIELYNAGDAEIDISGWTLTQHQTQMPIFSSVKIPAGTKLSARSFYLLGLSNSGLAVPSKKGESTVYVRNTSGMSVGDIIEIDNGSFKENHKIVKVGTGAGLGEPKTPSPFARPVEPGTPTTVWQPLPDGPVITIPAGSTNIPVTSIDGFEVGQKMAIGYGAAYPVVSQTIEKYEVVTITKVGNPGTQAWLSADAKAGDTNIKVSSVANISVGDKIRLDIDSKSHGIETVTVKSVGTQSARSTFNGQLKDTEDPGTGIELVEHLKFNHASNIPFSVRGTGINFEPATRFPHSSNEPVLPLGTGITLDQPLTKDHAIDAVVRDQKVLTAGYQGTSIPNQWFGGPALSSRAGNIVLHDAAGNIVDALNYGGLVDPWAAEGYQSASGTGENGCFVPSPSMGRGFRWWLASSTTQPNRSAGRYPDGKDNDSNCSDFLLQNTTTLSAASIPGSNNIKVANVENFKIGQKIIIGSGTNNETAVIAIIGTAGGTTVGTATGLGATAINVAGVEGFEKGQTITIDSSPNLETTVISSIIVGRRRFGSRDNSPIDSITVTVPLTKTHDAGVQISGSGITLSKPLSRVYDRGMPVSGNIPTPGKPNEY
ncbi:MAG TPA: arabinofuranosidase catalytic domain-containing protein [Ignavibacteriaceae bacterium]|nr:arabinofuranosidase catalytic domain-containing protein [Ignavibacteriaceae bacterium]